MRLAVVALLLVGLALAAGCGPRFANEQAYFSERQSELVADGAPTLALQNQEGKWYKWKLESGQAIVDVVTEEAGQVKVKRTIPFDSPGAAEEFLEKEKLRGTPTEMTSVKHRQARQAELNAVKGGFIGATPNGYAFGWYLTDGRVVVDTLESDGRGGVKITATTEHPDENTAKQAIGGEADNVIEWQAVRGAQLNGATLDWGMRAGQWLLFGWRLPDGKYQLDVLDSDTSTGVYMARTKTFDTLAELEAQVARDLGDPRATWLSSIQYSKGGSLLVLTMVGVGFFVLYNIARSKKAQGLTIRRIAGLDQIDEAIGRATETARPVLMVPGIGVLDGIAIQALTIFSSVIRSAARFGTPIRLLTADAAVFGVAQEMARDVYLSEGVPEQFDPNSVRFVSDRQFAFASGVAGVIQRERVAAAFLMGPFYAESLIFAENANMVGAIQVAATTQSVQTPFFIAACDYVLLGDEFYAASAYLGREPILLGSLVGVDWAKMAFMLFVLVAVIVHSIQTSRPIDLQSIPKETRDVMQKSGQKYLDWNNETFFLKLTREKRQ